MKSGMSGIALLAVIVTTGGGVLADEHGPATCPHAAGAGALTSDLALKLQAGGPEHAANPEVILTGEKARGSHSQAQTSIPGCESRPAAEA